MQLRNRILFLFMFLVLAALSARAELSAPKLLTPKNNEVSTNATPQFTWDAVPGAAAYEIEVGSDYDYKTLVVSATRVETTSFTAAKPFFRSSRFWHVRAIDASGNPGKWATTFVYRLQPEPKTTATSPAPAASAPAAKPAATSAAKSVKSLKLLSPANFEESTNAKPEFTWTPVTGAVAYEIEIAADNEFKKIVTPATRVETSSFTPASPMFPTTRFWRVRVIDAAGKPGAWSAFSVYKLKPAPLSEARPVEKRPAIYPAHNQAGIVQNPSFTWEAVPGAAAYEIEIAPDATFAKPVVPVTRVETPRYVPLTPLYPSARFWRTRVVTADGKAGKWSEPRIYKLREPANKINIPAAATLAEIRAAIAAAPASSLITFAPKATYRLNIAAGESYFLTLEKRDDLIIDGNDSMFVIENPSAGAFYMRECRGVTIRRMRFDYDPLPHSVGVVESVNRVSGGVSTITLRRLPGYPDFDAPHMLANWATGVILDPVIPGRMKQGSPLVVNFPGPHVVRNPAGEGLFDVGLPHANHGKFFDKGDRVIIYARNNTRGFCSADTGCEDITIDRVVTHAAPAGHFMGVNSSDLKILSCGSTLKDATRVYAGNADGVHVRANLIGPWIESCTFDSIGDDGVALYNKGIAIRANPSADTLTVEDGFMNLQPGDNFVIFNPFDGHAFGGARTVTAVKSAGNREWSVAFTPALESKPDFPMGDKTWWKNAQLFNRTRCNAGFVVKNNTFTSVRRYSVIVRSTDGVITGNNITGSSNSGITLLNEPHAWANGLHSERVLIARNKISASTFDASSTAGGAIAVNLRSLYDHSAEFRPAGKPVVKPDRLHRDIRIEDNTITDWNHHGILLRSATHCSVTGNTITAAPGAKFIDAAGKNIAILADNTASCAITGNAISDARLTTDEQRITITDSDAASVTGNR